MENKIGPIFSKNYQPSRGNAWAFEKKKKKSYHDTEDQNNMD